MFRSVSGKFYAVSDMSVQKVNLSEAVENEMKFCDFYLDFKHQVKKKISLDPDVPEISVAPADLTLFLSALIRYCMQAMKTSAVKEFSIATSCERGLAILRVQDTGAPMDEALKASLMKRDMAPPQAPEGTKGLFLAFALLGKYQARAEVSSVDSRNIYVVRFPLPAAGVKKG
jgi:hypothetical protein